MAGTSIAKRTFIRYMAEEVTRMVKRVRAAKQRRRCGVVLVCTAWQENPARQANEAAGPKDQSKVDMQELMLNVCSFFPTRGVCECTFLFIL